MKSSLFVFLFGLTAISAHAADSEWLLCNNDKLIVNSLEHRASADTRATDLTLILGGHVLRGELYNTDSDDNLSMSVQEGRYTQQFKGSIAIDYQTKRMTLNGILALANRAMPIDAKFDCKVMSN